MGILCYVYKLFLRARNRVAYTKERDKTQNVVAYLIRAGNSRSAIRYFVAYAKDS